MGKIPTIIRRQMFYEKKIRKCLDVLKCSNPSNKTNLFHASLIESKRIHFRIPVIYFLLNIYTAYKNALRFVKVIFFKGRP